MDLGLRGAAAVVNGGTGGMGRATAECFAADGARVAIFGRTQSTLDETVRALRELGSPDAVRDSTPNAKAMSVAAGIAHASLMPGAPQPTASGFKWRSHRLASTLTAPTVFSDRVRAR